MKAFAIALAAVLLSFAGAFAQQSIQAAPQAQKSNAQKSLMVSIEKLDGAGVRTALDEGADPNWHDSEYASSGGSVLWTLANGTLDMAEHPMAEDKAVVILEMLFKAGAKLQPSDQDILFGPIVSEWVVFTEVLLRNGANPTREIGGNTPMEMAVQDGDVSMIEVLKKYGAPALEPKEAVQQRFIGAASSHDIHGMEDALDDGADVNGRNRQGKTALVEACSIFRSVRGSAAVLYLLKKGADPTVKEMGQDDNGPFETNALHRVMWSSRLVFDKNNQNTNEDLKVGVVSVIKALLQHGAFVSARDDDGRTPLHIAARWSNVVGAKMLIGAGCKIMPKDNKGKTPLDYAESAEMIKLLKDHGAKEQ